MADDYALYPTDRAGSPAPADETGAVPLPGGWQVLVEYSNDGQAKPPTKVHVFPDVHETLQVAEALAFDHQPPDPVMPRGREVYADGEDFLSIVEGAMSTFHFSTRVVRRLTRPGSAAAGLGPTS